MPLCASPLRCSWLRTMIVALWSLAMLLPMARSQEQSPAASPIDPAVARQLAELTALVEKLRDRVDALEGKLRETNAAAGQPAGAAVANSVVAGATATPTQISAASGAPSVAAAADNDLLRGTSVNVFFDGYYQYNFNDPIGRANLLRAYDVSSNAFSLNQVGVVFENAPDPDHGKRFGMRLDLQYGQATQTTQGNAANEPRPEIYRNVFQAYGTYVAPVGKGLTIDFGKWASSLGIEGNYTKDQINYSRSFWFDFLPFYHAGARLNYKVNDQLALNYWLTNGTQQTEPFKAFKDELFGFVVSPSKNVSWTANYYLGQEHPDFMYVPGLAQANLPSLQGTPFVPIANAPKGKLHILDTYVSWSATPKLTLAGEFDYVVERLYTTSPPAHAIGGAGYARYQLSPRTAMGARGEYFSDRGGLFTGATQAIKEVTFTFDQKLANGFLVREEYRRDFSNLPYFLTNQLGVLKKEQNTATLGLVWWFGAKEGSW